MEQTLYERPREKLQRSGSTALTNAELLQIIIGSGGSGIPVARLARKVNEQLSRLDTPVSYTSLVAIKGVGAATALRVIASIEIGKRLSQLQPSHEHLDVSQLQSVSFASCVYSTYSGDGRIITTNVEKVVSKESSMLISRRICAKVLADNAWGVSVAVGYKSAQKQPGIFELSILADIKELTTRLQIKLLAVQYVTGRSSTYLYKAISI